MSCQDSPLCKVFLDQVVPVVGSLTSLLIYIAPWKEVSLIIALRELGGVNVLPYAMMVCNSIAWLMYSFLIRNYFVMVTNLMGYGLGIYYTLQTYRFSTSAQQVSVARLLLVGTVVIFSASGISFVFISDPVSAKLFLGWVAVILLAAFYSSPLSTLYAVLQERSAKSLSWNLAAASLLNSALWTCYGVTLDDSFIWAPNGFGIVVALVQLVLLYLYGGSVLERQRLVSSPRVCETIDEEA
ncbi:sugar efflux transporter for intercellular exchange-domain-containing protein [Polychytrium aggregatum]|uniref:sugar efflux transporter for intercellular exchange-domain-containing protein n=1 Tax=Polychytrium aggregatum TaxID=110093 RepID=UPI0022FE035E|nr:sugar efflux transporter for intercellular exchange-domain-containing protein [Polychytrium aggregatum]KAI9203575.1 sugar efflux transporter for intercellular exchange-domain-containing protein [Polychytrium aggregatum]